MMRYRTPNIDRLAKEGANLTDFYGQQSCTAGRATFITGESPLRTGLTKVGLSRAETGLSSDNLCVAQFMKSLGYATGQFGKNHLGDPFEEGPDSDMYYEEWLSRYAYFVVPPQAMVAKWLSTLKEFPIRQRPASFNLDSAVERMMPRT